MQSWKAPPLLYIVSAPARSLEGKREGVLRAPTGRTPAPQMQHTYYVWHNVQDFPRGGGVRSEQDNRLPSPMVTVLPNLHSNLLTVLPGSARLWLLCPLS